MDFTDKGKKEFQDVTRAIAAARRRQRAARPDARRSPSTSRSCSTTSSSRSPYIDYQENPDGIDGQTGAQISGAFTVQSAQDLANFLKIGALPIRSS